VAHVLIPGYPRYGQQQLLRSDEGEERDERIGEI
jgi:hypothetical protein